MEEIQKTRAILIGCTADSLEKEKNSDEESMRELCELLATAGGEPIAEATQNRTAPDVRTFIGEGKLQEIKELIENENIELAVFDNDLSPSQLQNVQEILDIRVIDRAALILDIFASRAKSAEGKLQVELAQYSYLLPRLTGMGTSLSRLGGGIGTRGPGETKLESDRRHIRARIAKLKEELKDVQRIRATERRKREKSSLPVAALVGYTNAGKSTLLNTLTGANIQANNRLFDTLDPTTKTFTVSDTLTILLTDTVGFIRRLPHHLISAFKATLDELKYADLVLVVLDASSEQCEAQREVVEHLIDELCKPDTPRIYVYNKIDALAKSAQIKQNDTTVAISAKEKTGIDRLKEAVAKALEKKLHTLEIKIPYAKANLVELLHREASVQTVTYEQDYILVKATCSPKTFGTLTKELGSLEK